MNRRPFVDTRLDSLAVAATSEDEQAVVPAPFGEAPAPTGADDRPGGETFAADEDDHAYRVKLDMFEGPLDLLLHLIRKHELDILDIPVSFITEKYLEYLDLLTSVQIDVASEYLVMAATLTHIKSKMLLPQEPSDQADEDGEVEMMDPRAELVRRLLEYQKYKHAADQLGGRAALGRDIFPRGASEPVPEGPTPLAPGNVFKLFDAFEKVLKRAHQEADHQVLFERVGIAERIIELTELLHDNQRMRFDDLFVVTDADGNPKEPTRFELVVTFLALLEMCKMRVALIVQDDPLGEIVIEFAAKHQRPEHAPPNRADAVLHPDADPWQDSGDAEGVGMDEDLDEAAAEEPLPEEETSVSEEP